MSGLPWSAQEIDALRRTYPVRSWNLVLASVPGRTKAAVRCKVISLDIRKEKNSRVSWLGSELALVRKLYPRAPWPEICAAIPRHAQSAIAKQANSMNLARDRATKRSRFAIIQELRSERQRRKIPQAALAQLIGSHTVQLANWERGQQMPRLRSFFDWVQALEFRLLLERVVS